MKQIKKITFVIPSLGQGGAERVVSNLEIIINGKSVGKTGVFNRQWIL